MARWWARIRRAWTSNAGRGMGVAIIVAALIAMIAGSLPSLAQAHREPGRPVGQGKLSHSQLLRDEAAWYQLSHYGKKTPSLSAMQKAVAQAQHMSAAGPALGTIPNSGTWRGLGPQPLDSTTCPSYCNNYGLNSGRITAVAVSPTSSNTIWVGAAAGGVWESTNGGTTWTAKFDKEPVLAIGSIAIDPNNANTIYVGTGEANNSGDSIWGAGVFKSTNGGASWTQLGLSSFGGGVIGRIAVDPHNSSNIIAAAGNWIWGAPPGGPSNQFKISGIWRSTNGGSSWSQVLHDSSTSAFYTDSGTDVVFDPSHTGVVYAGLGNEGGDSTSIAGVYKSTNSGANWTLLSSGIPTGANDFRTTIGLSKDGTHVYAAISNPAGDILNGKIYVSTNSGGSFTGHDITIYSGFADDDGGHQWWYDIYTMADQTNVNRAYVGGVDVWRTNDGGVTWTNTTQAYGGGLVHPDQHALAFYSSTSSNYYIGNDGGMWKGTVTSGPTSYTNINSGGLNITQFYGGSAGDLGGHAQIYGGAQDNGELQYPATACSTCSSGAGQKWNEVYGGDGGYTVVDFFNDSLVYEEYVDGAISCSTDGGSTWNPCTNGLAGSVNFIMPFIESPNNHDELLAGTDQVYKTTNDAGSWTPLGAGPLDGNPISALAVAKGNDNYIYAGLDDGTIWGTTNGGSTWNDLTPTIATTGGMVTGLSVSPTSPSTVYATYADFASGSGQHLLRSTNAGAVWTDISAALPNAPFDSVLVYPTNPNVIMVGTDVGAFYTANGGSNWYVLGNGLPNVPVDQIFVDRWESGLYVATHGRGMWELSGHTYPSPASININSTGNPAPTTLQLVDTGYGVVSWSLASTLPSWLSISPTSGVIKTQTHFNITLTFHTSGPGTYTTTLKFNTTRGDNPTVSVPVTVTVS